MSMADILPTGSIVMVVGQTPTPKRSVMAPDTVAAVGDQAGELPPAIPEDLVRAIVAARDPQRG